MSKRQSIRHIISIGISGAIALSASDLALAAPVLSSTAVVKSSLPSDTLNVRSRNRSGAVAAGAAIGIIGAIVGNAVARNQGYYGPGYAPGYYAPGYAPYASPYYGNAPYYGPGYYGSYPYAYGHYGYDNRGAVAAGAVIGAMIGAAAASGQYRRGIRRQPYIYLDPQRVW